MSLTRLDADGFHSLQRDWSVECEKYGEEFGDFASEQIEHARKIACESPPDKRYGIFELTIGGKRTAIMHVNRAALPRTQGQTLRVLWVLLAPRYDMDDVTVEEFSSISTEMIYGAHVLSQNDMRADHEKIHLGNFSDRQFFAGLSSILSRNSIFKEIGLRGNWFHFSTI